MNTLTDILLNVRCVRTFTTTPVSIAFIYKCAFFHFIMQMRAKRPEPHRIRYFLNKRPYGPATLIGTEYVSPRTSPLTWSHHRRQKRQATNLPTAEMQLSGAFFFVYLTSGRLPSKTVFIDVTVYGSWTLHILRSVCHSACS